MWLTDGRLLFTALPSGLKVMMVAEVGGLGSQAGIAFENPDTLFPQRVIYKLQGTRLLASIEGTRHGRCAAHRVPDEARQRAGHRPRAGICGVVVFG